MPIRMQRKEAACRVREVVVTRDAFVRQYNLVQPGVARVRNVDVERHRVPCIAVLRIDTVRLRDRFDTNFDQYLRLLRKYSSVIFLCLNSYRNGSKGPPFDCGFTENDAGINFILSRGGQCMIDGVRYASSRGSIVLFSVYSPYRHEEALPTTQ